MHAKTSICRLRVDENVQLFRDVFKRFCVLWEVKVRRRVDAERKLRSHLANESASTGRNLNGGLHGRHFYNIVRADHFRKTRAGHLWSLLYIGSVKKLCRQDVLIITSRSKESAGDCKLWRKVLFLLFVLQRTVSFLRGCKQVFLIWLILAMN